MDNSSDKMLVSQQLKQLRTSIVDFLIYRLKNDMITEKRASQIARAALDKLVDHMSDQQIQPTIKKFQEDFPDESQDLAAAMAASETSAARKAVDHSVLSEIKAGNIGVALEILGKFEIK